MKIHRVVYIVNARLPTEKAHGLQVCKMCEAFAQLGVDVVLLHPYRRQLNSKLQGQNIFDYYGIKPVFAVRTLSNWDVVPFARFVPERIFAPVFFVSACVWGWHAASTARYEQTDLYYTRDSAVAYWLVRMGLPTVYEAHVVPRRARRWLLRHMAVCPALRLVVALTSYIRERFIEMGFPEEKVIISSDAVDLTLFEGLPSKEECRQRLSLPAKRAIIGYIGRFRTMEMEKGIPELVRAMACLPSLNGREPLLLCVGGPMDAVPAYLKLASRMGLPESRLKFIDHVNHAEIPHWVRACDVVTIPWPWTEFSAYFTSPLKLFEYMAAGVPIVATDLPSLREILRHGENAWLVEPGVSEALAEGIHRILCDRGLGGKIAKHAWQDVQQYSWERRAATILDSAKQT